jgi:hypothetical protein
MTAVWSWSGQQPSWITDVEDAATGRVLNTAWLLAEGRIDLDDAVRLHDCRFALNHVAELVRDAELFDTNPQVAVDEWNTRCRDTLQYAEAAAMRDQLRADALAVTEAVAIAAIGAYQPQHLKAV